MLQSFQVEKGNVTIFKDLIVKMCVHLQMHAYYSVGGCKNRKCNEALVKTRPISYTKNARQTLETTLCSCKVYGDKYYLSKSNGKY